MPSAAPEKPFRRPPSPKFRVYAELDNRGVKVPCTVIVHRPAFGTGEVVLSVRPLRRRKRYEVLLSDVARWAYRSQVRAEVESKRKARRVRR